MPLHVRQIGLQHTFTDKHVMELVTWIAQARPRRCLKIEEICIFYKKKILNIKRLLSFLCVQLFIILSFDRLLLFWRKCTFYGNHSCQCQHTKGVCVRSWILYSLGQHMTYYFLMILLPKKLCRFFLNSLTDIQFF